MGLYMNENNMQKKVDQLKLNQNIIDIIYQYAPYKKYNLFFSCGVYFLLLLALEL